MKKTLSIVAATAALLLALAGCGGVTAKDANPPKSDSSDTKSEPETQPSEAPEPEPNPQDDMIFAFGDTVTYEDGVSLSISAPAPYTPGAYAAGVDFPNQIHFNLTLTNGTASPYDPLVYGTLASGGVEGSQIFDSANNLGGSPNTTVLPGQTITWTEAWSVTDPANLTYSVSPGFQYIESIFTNTQ